MSHWYFTEFRLLSECHTGALQSSDFCLNVTLVLYRVQTSVWMSHWCFTEFRLLSECHTGALQSSDFCLNVTLVLYRVQTSVWMSHWCFTRPSRSVCMQFQWHVITSDTGWLTEHLTSDVEMCTAMSSRSQWTCLHAFMKVSVQAST